MAAGAVVPTPTRELRPSIVKMGVPVAALVAKLNALMKLGMVAVAVLWNASVVVAAVDDPKVMILESRYVFPPTEK